MPGQNRPAASARQSPAATGIRGDGAARQGPSRGARIGAAAQNRRSDQTDSSVAVSNPEPTASAWAGAGRNPAAQIARVR